MQYTVTVAYCKKALNKTNRWWVFYEAQTQWGEIDNKNWIVAHMSSSLFIGQPHPFLHCIPFGTMQCYIVEGKPCETLRLPKVKCEFFYVFSQEKDRLAVKFKPKSQSRSNASGVSRSESSSGEKEPVALPGRFIFKQVWTPIIFTAFRREKTVTQLSDI